MTVTEAARNFADLVNRTYYKGESTLLIRAGKVVAKIVPVGGSSILGRDLGARWREIEHLDATDAEAFAQTIEKARADLATPEPAWD